MERLERRGKKKKGLEIYLMKGKIQADRKS
jgi:hypothetical protein